MSLALAIMLAGEASTLPKVSVAYQNSIRSYAACIEADMIELEPSKASIEDIFEAAKMQCSGTWGDSYHVMVEDFDKGAPARSGKTSQQMSIEILEGVAQMSKNRSRVVILRKRAGLPPINDKQL